MSQFIRDMVQRRNMDGMANPQSPFPAESPFQLYDLMLKREDRNAARPRPIPPAVPATPPTPDSPYYRDYMSVPPKHRMT